MEYTTAVCWYSNTEAIKAHSTFTHIPSSWSSASVETTAIFNQYALLELVPGFPGLHSLPVRPRAGGTLQPPVSLRKPLCPCCYQGN